MKEHALLSHEEEESSFEVVGRVRHEKKIKRTKEKEKMHNLLESRKKDEDLRIYIRNEIKSLEVKMSKEIGLLHEYCRGRFDSICALIHSSQIYNPVPMPSVVTPLRPEYLDDVVCIEESTPQSLLRKRRHVGQPDQVIFPGRQHLLGKDAKRIESILAPSPADGKLRDPIFESGNIVMSRADFNDMLDQGWLSDTHIDAFAVVLSNRRNASPRSWKPSLYVSPNYAYYKSCAVPFTRLISHITTATIAVAEYIMMSVHLGAHWALLVGNLRDSSWSFYDSFPSQTHRQTLPSLIAGLHGDAREALPKTMSGWPIDVVHSAPMQDNSHDCGMFVLKYMEAVTSVKKVLWDEFSDWQSNMPKFRAKLAHEMIQTFRDD